MPSELEQSIYNSIRYFDVLDVPVTATQIWQCLLVEKQAGPRWGGHRHWTLVEVQQVLRKSDWLGQRAETKWGYYFLSGRAELVRQRLTRHRISQAKWKIALFAARFLAAVPFIRGLAGSGSLELDNARKDSDLDFLVFTAPRRIWTTRLLLLAVSQLLGRRRKHWYTRAPDMVCLNHYVSTSHLRLPVELHNTYTAVQYEWLIPVYRPSVVRAFQQANASWIYEHIMVPNMPAVGHLYTLRLPRFIEWGKRLLESILLEPVGDGVEAFAERLQRRSIIRHQVGRAGRVAVSDTELAFHPDTKVPALLAQYHQDPGQASLL